MSDRIAVMRAGRIEQVAPPEDIFDRPATAYVADFIGSSNFWAATASAGRVALPDGQVLAAPGAEPGAVRVMARPHNLRIAAGETGPWRGRVLFHRSVGALVDYHVATDLGEIRVTAMRSDRARPLGDGAAVTLAVIDPALCMAYPAA